MLFRKWAQVAAQDAVSLGTTAAVTESAVATGSGGYAARWNIIKRRVSQQVRGLITSHTQCVSCKTW